ncbi:aTP synthase subunit b [Prevotella sp. CAG:617]|jgi:F-type H+-transporting ATPase subunit b|nr:aTP synthase subunit b [Prevotella sp. CAG:617]
MPSFLTPDLGLLFWMFLAFVIVFGVLAKFGFPVITKMVEDRKKYIDESLQNARIANEKLSRVKIESEKLIQEAREQQDRILKEAMATQQSIISEAKSKALVESNKLLENAKKQIQVEKENALREIRAQVADLSVNVAEKILLRKLDKTAEQDQFVERLVDEALASK